MQLYYNMRISCCIRHNGISAVQHNTDCHFPAAHCNNIKITGIEVNKLFSCSYGSSVSIVSDYGLDDRAIGVRSPAGAKDFFLYPLCPDRL
jgi:hypothetical protein